MVPAEVAAEDPINLFTYAQALLALAACEEAPADKRAGSPHYRPPTPAEAACDRQGYLRGTNDFEACMARETGQDRAAPPVVAPQVS